jgi:signal transduction histidine kinase
VDDKSAIESILRKMDPAEAAQLREVLDSHDALVSITSHELKTPLTAIKAMAELMLQYDLGEAQQKEMMGDIFRQAERLEQLIREILDASQIDSGRMSLEVTELDLRDVVGEVLDELATQLNGRKLRVAVARTVPHVMADRAKLHQIVVNLLTNAIKYSPATGAVSLGASSLRGKVRVEVKDHGIGIREEDIGRLFKKFQRIHNPGATGTPGTGLGLYIVKGLVELQGGTIEVTSVYGKGSTFAFTLPAVT